MREEKPHYYKMFERIPGNRIPDIAHITAKQATFEIRTIELQTQYPLRKKRQKLRTLYIVFLKLEKTLERAPGKFSLYALRLYLVGRDSIAIPRLTFKV